MNFTFLTTIYENNIRIHRVVMSNEADKVTYHDNFWAQPEIFEHLGENAFIQCIRITEAHVYVNIFV